MERYREQLAAELPEVDVWCGLDWSPLLAQLGAESGEAAPGAVAVPRRPRPVSAFIKISDGCDRRCAYCAIPLIKGEYETVPAVEIVRASRAALAAGALELVLVGQDTSRWVQPGWGGLGRLLAELTALAPAPAWLRLLYLQPDGVDDGLLEALGRYATPYLDIPLQHASGGVLRRMGRGGDGAAHLSLLSRVRRALPGAAVRSTFITGFPGESEEDVDELVAFVRAAGLSAAGVFAFDAQEGTPAARLPGQVWPEVASERAARVGQAIDEVAEGFWAGLIGCEIDVLVERGTSRADGVAVGRCALQAPDIDGRVLLAGAPMRRGQLVRASVTGSVGYDVEAVAGSTKP